MGQVGGRCCCPLEDRANLDKKAASPWWRKREGYMKISTLSVVEKVRKDAHPVKGAPRDYDPLLDRIGNARFVLIGEASHGTHEFYQQRAEITKRLIKS